MVAISAPNKVIHQYHVTEVGNNMAFGEWKPVSYLGQLLTL